MAESYDTAKLPKYVEQKGRRINMKSKRKKESFKKSYRA